jgi:hypothetical protein
MKHSAARKSPRAAFLQLKLSSGIGERSDREAICVGLHLRRIAYILFHIFDGG